MGITSLFSKGGHLGFLDLPKRVQKTAKINYTVNLNKGNRTTIN